jgi:hypothetical protein
MKIRYCAAAVSVALAVLVFASLSQAADVTFYVGGINPGSIEKDDREIQLEGGPVFGFRLSSDFVPHFGMEHTLAFSSDFLFPEGAEDVSDAKGFIYNSNLLISLPAGRVEPYLTAGVGLINQWGSSNLPVGTKPAFNYGGGVKVPDVWGPFGLKFDIRAYRAGFVTDSVNMIEMSGGVFISIGR